MCPDTRTFVLGVCLLPRHPSNPIFRVGCPFCPRHPLLTTIWQRRPDWSWFCPERGTHCYLITHTDGHTWYIGTNDKSTFKQMWNPIIHGSILGPVIHGCDVLTKFVSRTVKYIFLCRQNKTKTAWQGECLCAARRCECVGARNTSFSTQRIFYTPKTQLKPHICIKQY